MCGSLRMFVFLLGRLLMFGERLMSSGCRVEFALLSIYLSFNDFLHGGKPSKSNQRRQSSEVEGVRGSSRANVVISNKQPFPS